MRNHFLCTLVLGVKLVYSTPLAPDMSVDDVQMGSQDTLIPDLPTDSEDTLLADVLLNSQCKWRTVSYPFVPPLLLLTLIRNADGIRLGTYAQKA